MRNTPDAARFIELAEREGVPAVVAERDGPFGDYSQAPPEEQPDPSNVVEVPLEEGGLHADDERER
jgi:enoyl-CoA hydratase